MNFTIEVNRDTFDVVQRLGLFYGYSWINCKNGKKMLSYESGWDFISFNSNIKKMARSCRHIDENWNFTKICLDELVSSLENKLPDIKIGPYSVIFNKDNIEVGCQKITNDQIKEIYNRVFNKG